MEVKFYEDGSKIYDFLRFPKLLYSKNRYGIDEKNKDEDFMRDYISFAYRISERIKNYSEQIDIYYGEAIFREYDLVDLLIVGIPIFEYKDIDSYFEHLASLTESDLITKTVETMILMSRQDIGVDEVLKSGNLMFNFIDKLNIEAKSKWRILGLIENPKDYMDRYIYLMESIRDVFEEVYMNYSFEVFDCGNRLNDYFNENGIDGIDNITGGLISSKVLKISEINLFISAIMPYKLSIMTASKKPYIVWGLKVEERFKRVKKIEEDNVNARLKVFENISERVNYDILILLLKEHKTNEEIARELDITGATVSHHINGLLTSKVLKIDREKKGYDYVINKEFILDSIEKLSRDLDLESE